VIAGAPGYGTEPWLPDEVHLALIDQIAVDYCIDMRHINTVGYSSSAPKAMRLACEAPDRIASVVASVAPFRTNCEPTRPVPLLAFTGDRDRSNTTSSVEWWAEANGCDAEPVDDDLGSGVTRRTYENCRASVVFYDIADTGHGVFFRECIGVAPLPLGDVFCQQNAVVDQLDEMDSFLAEHPLIPEKN
jgi:poly(3-hydroxybutyrate) depolymerase